MIQPITSRMLHAKRSLDARLGSHARPGFDARPGSDLPEAACSSTFIHGLPRCGTTPASYTLQTGLPICDLHSEATCPPKIRSYLRML